jgi:hypothetical protein
MIKFDINEINKMANRIKNLKSNIKIGKKRYLKMLIGSSNINIQGKLKSKINKLVYQTEEPDFYERTYDLFNSVKVMKTDNKTILYIDDEWLSTRPQVINKSKSTGTATNAHGNPSTPYSLRVEKDFNYRNERGHDYNRKGSHYMEETFNELVSDVINGEADPIEIINPILKKWSN